MNNRQKLVQKQFLNNEEAVIKQLKLVYGDSLKDINTNIEKLMERFDPKTGEYPQSVIYQIKYQQMLKAQVEGILNQMQTKQYTTIAQYLDGCYEDGFIGSIFDLHGQGIPMMIPIDQQAMVRAVQMDSKISKGLYTKLGEDVADLKKRIMAQVSRSISTGTSFEQTARQLADCSKIGFNKAVRIARTEGHRIQCASAMDAMEQAKVRGADVVKQWDAALDAKTRDSHARVDGEIREINKRFSNGLTYPGDPSGNAAEVVNCRCALLQRARWAVEKETSYQKWNNETGGFIECTGYEDFKEKYLDVVESLTTSNNSGIISIEQFRIFTSGDEVNKFFGGEGGLLERKKSVEKQWLKNLSTDESQAISYYCSDGYYDVNAYFRKVAGSEYIDADAMKEFAKDLDSAIDKFNLSENITVYRGIDNDALKDLDLNNLVGSVYEDKGYMSTSPIHADIVKRRDALLEIQVPSGQGRGAYVNSLSGFKDDEYEFLLKRGTKCEITSVDLTGDKPIIRMKVIDE